MLPAFASAKPVPEDQRVPFDLHMTSYPSYDGKGAIRVMFSSMWDPDGHYVELNEVVGGLK